MVNCLTNVHTRHWLTIPFPPKAPAHARDHVESVCRLYKEKYGAAPPWVVTPYYLFRTIALSEGRPDEPQSFSQAVLVGETYVSWAPEVTMFTLAGPLPNLGVPPLASMPERPPPS